MNTQAQYGPLGFILVLIIFVMIWALWLGSYINTWADLAISSGDVTGIEAFIIANLNLWIGIFLFIAVGAMLYLGGRQ